MNLINQYQERLKVLKVNRTVDTNSDEENHAIDNEIRLTAQFIKDLKETYNSAIEKAATCADLVTGNMVDLPEGLEYPDYVSDDYGNYTWVDKESILNLKIN